MKKSNFCCGRLRGFWLASGWVRVYWLCAWSKVCTHFSLAPELRVRRQVITVASGAALVVGVNCRIAAEQHKMVSIKFLLRDKLAKFTLLFYIVPVDVFRNHFLALGKNELEN
ncbi:MAG: hypothetical protein EAZ92_00740 [Candidatus Kapaibacterium sp.]|nr:MAG: hypothetical protein EAZ92_00740 [Candidatus Kapabacteria bacterium]